MSTDILPGQFAIAPDGTKIWTHACGNPTKPAVVFIHGFVFTADVFEKQYVNPTMLENLYIIRYDLRGSGRSDGPMSEQAYSSEHQAEDFKAVIDTFNVQKPFVATWSFGGLVPSDVLAKYGPDSIAGVILLGSFMYGSAYTEHQLYLEDG
ncbi:hypothetical protein VKT23_006373 [Stygiomarasmius scandens]|uniref:AB hydrolase-1 domain-containing protein n=1 Tax=Marasmiellus scandens TaxID=2682957 RepID=A0ABR1JPN2_9AGAR